jgi:hypothetical protein
MSNVSLERCIAGVVITLITALPGRAADDDGAGRKTLEAAIQLAGRHVVRFPITLVSVLPDGASPGIEAWAVREAAHDGRVFVYTGSKVFLCARMLPGNHQCLVKLASIIVHEAWHLRFGPSEAGAYEEQIAFLLLNGGSGPRITEVRRARNHVLARQIRRAGDCSGEN